MTVDFQDLQDALAAYWGKKHLQLETSRIANAVGAGTAGAVRGGGHFDPVAALIARLFIEAGYAPGDIRVQRSHHLELPGYYRPTKQWDVVVANGGVLVAAFELKALGGPSFGNNANNRVEEALGSAVDVRRASLAELFPKEQPWLGYLFVMEDAPGSRRAVRVDDGAVPADSVWRGMSYQARFALFCERLIEERVYDAVCYLVSGRDDVGPRQPVPSADWLHFVAAIRARIEYLRGLGYPKR